MIRLTLGNTNPPTWWHIPQDFHLQQQCIMMSKTNDIGINKRTFDHLSDYQILKDPTLWIYSDVNAGKYI